MGRRLQHVSSGAGTPLRTLALNTAFCAASRSPVSKGNLWAKRHALPVLNDSMIAGREGSNMPVALPEPDGEREGGPAVALSQL